MADEKQPETTGSTNEASAPEVKKDASAPDYMSMLREKDERIAKIEQDKANYRKGMLKYKRELEENPGDSNLEEERIRQIVQETLINSDLTKAQQEKDALINSMAKQLSEAKITIANKSQMTSFSGGSNDSEDLTVESLTPEQKAYFEDMSKTIGVKIDPKKFLENMRKNKSNK